MRKILLLVMASFLLAIIVGTVQPASGQFTPAQQAAEQMMQSHTGDRPVASQIVAQTPSQPVDAASVTYGSVEGTPITGYLARPADATEPLPALIVIHEWWGLNDNIEMMTRRLAGEGYTALAVDLYEGNVAETPDEARSLSQTALENSSRLYENLRQAYQYLENEQSAPTIASIGWCFGGSWSLNTALLYPQELDAAVIYYGGRLVTDSEQLAPLEMPILGIFAGLDDNPSPEAVADFETALNSLDKTSEIHIYPDADHAFANPSGTRYDAEAAADAWNKTIAFLEQHL